MLHAFIHVDNQESVAFSPELGRYIQIGLAKMIDTYAVPYKESMALHTKVYPNEKYKSLAMQVDEVLGQLQNA